MMNRIPLIVAAATAAIAAVFTHWIGGWTGVVYASLFIAGLAWVAYQATAVIIHGRAPGINPLAVGTYTWVVIAALVVIIIIAAIQGRGAAIQKTGEPLTPDLANERIVAHSRQIASAQNLRADQRQAVADLVPPILAPTAPQEDIRQAYLDLNEAEEMLKQFSLENERAQALAKATLPRVPPRGVPWQYLFLAEVRQNTLQTDEQIRRAAVGQVPYIVQEIGSTASLTLNPARQTGIWYVGLPLAGISAEDKGRGFQGHFQNFVTSSGRAQAHFEVAGAPHATNDSIWINLRGGGTLYTDPSSGDYGVFIRWKKDLPPPNETFSVTSQYVLGEWPTSWQVRIQGLPPSDRTGRKALPITVVPTTLVGLPGPRVDSLVCLTITGSNGQVVPVAGEVWFGHTSHLISDPRVELSTIGEDNPALAIEHFCAEAVNVDITFLPRTQSSL